MLGLKRGIVKLSPYCDEWAQLYEKEEMLLRHAIGDYIIDIQHVGSTSISGLVAKPIIDISAGVKSLDIGEKCIEPLTRLGYEYKHDAGIKGRHFFAKGYESNRTHYLHISEWNGEIWQNHILFRDYLREHKEAIEEYARIKNELAQKYANDRDSYTAGKNGFIKGIIEKAKKEMCV